MIIIITIIILSHTSLHTHVQPLASWLYAHHTYVSVLGKSQMHCASRRVASHRMRPTTIGSLIDGTDYVIFPPLQNTTMPPQHNSTQH
ncbi:hypothetical protein F5Y08DRAFT_35802 [Xylaria arbuscula]|nr:hypothetical protein F5Y08DRAFT_35802 [Xylaria arbuscula]